MQASNSPFLDAFAEHAPATLSGLPGAGLAWLDKVRREHLGAFLRDGLPSPRNEAWKYTALRSLQQKSFRLGDADASVREVDPSSLALPGISGPRLVFVNGVFRQDLSLTAELPDGLSLQPWSQAVQTNAERLRFFLAGKAEPSDGFAQMNAAMAGDGVVLRVADGVVVKPTVHLVFVGAPTDESLAWHLRSLIEVGAGAKLKLVEHHLDSGARAQLATTAAEFEIGTDASLDVVMLQNAAEDATLIRRNQLRLDARAKVSVHALELGASLARHDLECELRGDGAQLRTRGVFVPRQRQHVDVNLDIRHDAVNTSSDALWRGVADQRGRGVFQGRITVAPGADGSDARLSNKNLLLSPHAEIDTMPVLEIYADEVQAAHGATVGQLDESSLFYLRSRGIPLAQARNLLTAAFCRAALDSVDDEALRKHLNALLVEHLPVPTGCGAQPTADASDS